jgi:cell division protein FtsW
LFLIKVAHAEKAFGLIVKMKKTGLDVRIAMVVILLMAIGALFVFSAGVNVVRKLDLERFYEFTSLRQIIFFPLAVLLMLGVSRIDYHVLSLGKRWFKCLLPYLVVLAAGLLVAVLIPSVGISKNYARRWLLIPLGPLSISFQPSEAAKWITIFFVAAFCAKFHDTMGLFKKRLLPLCLIVGLIAGLILMEDFGTAALIALLTWILLFIAGAKLTHLLLPLPLACGGFVLAIIKSPVRVQRIMAFLNPDKWTDSYNYQPFQSLIALGSGGLFGKGLGRGICKFGHLPEDTTDFIFAIIGEELGLVGNFMVIGLFIIFVWLGLLASSRAKDKLGEYLAAAVTLTIAIQAALNIGVVTVVLPTKGIPLPFVSAGGTSLLVSAVAAGVLMSIARQPGENFDEVPELLS